MPITFGLVGDIISVCLVIKDLLDALNQSRDSPKEYQEVIHELWILDRALLEVDLLMRTCNATVKLVALCETARLTVEKYRRSVESFLEKIKKYGPSLCESGSGNILRDTSVKIRWQISQKDEVTKFRAELGAYILLSICFY
jgi:hypothetical protein